MDARDARYDEELSTADLAADRPRDDVRDDRDVIDVRDATEVDRGVVAQPAAPAAAPEPAAEPLLAPGDSHAYQARWTDVQNGFVDEPRRAVEEADMLVAELMQHLAKSFADERGRLEGQWDRGDEVSTDELRVAFQRYRAFFGRLLST
jgi:hypothetical protein